MRQLDEPRRKLGVRVSSALMGLLDTSIVGYWACMIAGELREGSQASDVWDASEDEPCMIAQRDSKLARAVVKHNPNYPSQACLVHGGRSQAS